MESIKLLAEIMRSLRFPSHLGYRGHSGSKALEQMRKTLSEVVYPELQKIQEVWSACLEPNTPRYREVVEGETEKIEIEPFIHDCTVCIWMGWVLRENIPANMYFCPGSRNDIGTIILRYSDEPSDYLSRPVWRSSFNKPSSIRIGKEQGEEMTKFIKKRDDWYAEDNIELEKEIKPLRKTNAR
ncbi:MAG: hypothetical protein CL582_23440 [Alteromonadaceae bacterium]|nr:hypothetical protein [Alteromonadaceae bacterium]